MGWSEVGDTVCPIARALAVVGDRWTVLILRELFLGVKRFEEFQQQTGMSPHLLSTRLKRLEAEGIVVRRPYSERPVRHALPERLAREVIPFAPRRARAPGRC